MEGLISLVMYWAVFIALILFPVWLAIRIFRFFREKQSILRFFAFIPVLIAGQIIYYLLDPTDSRYKEIFREITDTEYPSNARIKDKYSNDLSWLNSLTIAKIILNPDQVSEMSEQLIENGYTPDKDPHEYQELKFNIPGKFQMNEHENIHLVLYKRPADQPDTYYGIAFLTDGKTVIIKKNKDNTDRFTE